MSKGSWYNSSERWAHILGVDSSRVRNWKRCGRIDGYSDADLNRFLETYGWHAGKPVVPFSKVKAGMSGVYFDMDESCRELSQEPKG